MTELTRNQQRVLEHLKRCKDKGCTQQELADFLGISFSTSMTACRQLQRKGLVVMAGTRPGGKESTPCVVYKVVCRNGAKRT